MGLYLQCEVESPLSPDDFQEQVIVPLGAALRRERLGCVLDRVPEDEPLENGQYEIAMEVTDPKRAKDLVEAVLKEVGLA